MSKSNVKYAYSRGLGRSIEVGTLDTPTPTKRAQKEAFAKVPLRWAAAAAKATKTCKALVWIELLHLAWKAGGPTFPVPCGKLERRGVDREVRRRALHQLEAAGLIRVAWQHGKTPVVTITELPTPVGGLLPTV
jgi:hypothetical protein